MKIEVEINFEDGAFIAEIYEFHNSINSNVCSFEYRETLKEAIADVNVKLSNCNFINNEVLFSTTENRSNRRVYSLDEMEMLSEKEYNDLEENSKKEVI